MKIFCCACQCEVECRLTNGAEVYRHRSDLSTRLFWKHDKCGNFVGCHDKSTDNKLKPLGCVPTQQIKDWRKKIHAVLDPLWRGGSIDRKKLYRIISQQMGPGYCYHTAEIRSVDEARRVLEIVNKIREKELT